MLNFQLIIFYSFKEFDGTLDCISLAVTCTFNKRGTLLAVGCNDGRIVIWDFLTRGIAKIISAHVHPVCSLSWSRNGHKLLSASTDNNVCIWDVLSGECDQKYRFPSPILKVQFHPRNPNKFLVCPMRHAAVLVDIEGTHRVMPLDEDVSKILGISPYAYDISVYMLGSSRAFSFIVFFLGGLLLLFLNHFYLFKNLDKAIGEEDNVIEYARYCSQRYPAALSVDYVHLLILPLITILCHTFEDKPFFTN